MNSLLETKPVAAPHKGEERILFSLGPKEKNLFLPETDLTRFNDQSCAHINPDGISAGDWEKTLRQHRPTVLVTAWNTPPIPVSWIESDDFSLRYLCNITGSVKSVAPRILFSRGVRMTNWGTLINHTIAEHALLMVLSLLRNTPAWPAAAVSGSYSADLMPVLRTRSLRGKRVGLHGFGAIAREIIALLKPFQVEIAACSQGVPRAVLEAQGVEPVADLETLFARSEVLIECESLTPHSRGSVTAAVLARLPHDAVFVNVGRGLIVDEIALGRLATEKQLRVGLDVFHQEPLPPDSPLAKIPGLLLSPHIAGPTWDAFPLCGDHALTNLQRYLNREPLTDEITVEIYDRAT
ncbi:hydroxyacid dehydrogenase [Rariglobus hedericola]|uniref:Hydroxyacid dehydrogenase n=1 Tax=Rariglobus hedericola TaxID=2597822 RepID=A0A556QRR1_9BACT|nr:hydroxyacid dehydrogenase [Rariglobus hedericola]TSJ79309.1 hydroxyacid dehydrogenase [Rariglobus hedericola]